MMAGMNNNMTVCAMPDKRQKNKTDPKGMTGYRPLKSRPDMVSPTPTMEFGQHKTSKADARMCQF